MIQHFQTGSRTGLSPGRASTLILEKCFKHSWDKLSHSHPAPPVRAAHGSRCSQWEHPWMEPQEGLSCVPLPAGTGSAQGTFSLRIFLRRNWHQGLHWPEWNPGNLAADRTRTAKEERREVAGPCPCPWQCQRWLLHPLGSFPRLSGQCSTGSCSQTCSWLGSRTSWGVNSDLSLSLGRGSRALAARI